MNLRLTLRIQNTKYRPNFHEVECTEGNIYLLPDPSQVATWKHAETTNANDLY